MNAYPVAGKQKSADICAAFIRGAPQNDGDVFYGVDESNLVAWRASVDYWYIDNSFFDSTRGTHYRVTHNDLQPSGVGATDGKRFDALNIEIKPWREAGEHVVICPQSMSYMRMIAGYEGDWLSQIRKELRTATHRELRVRPWNRDKARLASTLHADLRNSWALVTYSSAAAISAVLCGIPVVVTGPNAAKPMGGGRPADIERVGKPEHRRMWASVLADAQFTLEEMRSGLAWETLQ